MRIESAEALEKAVRRAKRDRPKKRTEVLVCGGTGCRANGSLDVKKALDREIGKAGLEIGTKLVTKATGCHGLCEAGPLVVVEPKGIFYERVKPKDAAEIVKTTLVEGGVVRRLLDRDPATKNRTERFAEIPFYANQHRIALRNLGRIDPTDIGDALAEGAYRSLAKALMTMSPDEVITVVEKSGLRGRGGAGFPTGKKWRTCSRVPFEPRYVLCNADEGDPGAFMDCAISEGDPHAVIEGMVIGAYAVGAHEGFIYVREEYPLAVERYGIAIRQAKERGLLGKDILGSGFDYDLRIARGGGAFVCGESTALMRSVAGEVGEPRAKYVHSVVKGLFDHPTVLNNVETWANVPYVIEHGAETFRALGTKGSPGTKAFSLVGKVRNTGLIEVPMGSTLRHIVFDVGGGIKRGRTFKAVQTGGPSGGCLPESALDTPVDFDTLVDAGSMMGSGGMIVMDDYTCMVDVARYFTKFLAEESCGKCTPCREGVVQLYHILNRIAEGDGVEEDLERIRALAPFVAEASLCGLGKSAPNPVLSTLEYFEDEVLAHIRDKKCPAGVCRNLTTFKVIPELCNGCRVCVKVCAPGAIKGERKKPHVIDPEVCEVCGVCRNACEFDAIVAVKA